MWCEIFIQRMKAKFHNIRWWCHLPPHDCHQKRNFCFDLPIETKQIMLRRFSLLYVSHQIALLLIEYMLVKKIQKINMKNYFKTKAMYRNQQLWEVIMLLLAICAGAESPNFSLLCGFEKRSEKTLTFASIVRAGV